MIYDGLSSVVYSITLPYGNDTLDYASHMTIMYSTVVGDGHGHLIIDK